MSKVVFAQLENLQASLSENDLQDEEEPMKYRNISIVKNKNCNTYRAKCRVGKKCKYISGKTQYECYQNLKEFMKPKNIKKYLEEQEKPVEQYTFDAWYKKWINLYKNGKIKETTIVSYNTLLNYIPESFKQCPMNKIKLETIIELINSIDKNRQKQKLYEFLNMIFEKAKDNEIIKSNPLKKIDKPRHKKQHSIALTINEQNELVNICKNIKNSDLILIGLFQGLRRGEALGLTRNKINFEERTITIDQAWSSNNRMGDTKNEVSHRVIRMVDSTYNILIKYKDLPSNQRLFDLTMKQYENFMKEVNNKFSKKLMYKDLRCTFLTNCLILQIPLHIIQSWVGHQIGSKVTNDSYTTIQYEAGIKFLSKVDNFIAELNI